MATNINIKKPLSKLFQHSVTTNVCLKINNAHILTIHFEFSEMSFSLKVRLGIMVRFIKTLSSGSIGSVV